MITSTVITGYIASRHGYVFLITTGCTLIVPSLVPPTVLHLAIKETCKLNSSRVIKSKRSTFNLNTRRKKEFFFCFFFILFYTPKLPTEQESLISLSPRQRRQKLDTLRVYIKYERKCSKCTGRIK